MNREDIVKEIRERDAEAFESFPAMQEGLGVSVFASEYDRHALLKIHDEDQQKTKELEAERDTLHAKLIKRNKEDIYNSRGYSRLQSKLRNFPVIPMMQAGYEEMDLAIWHKFAKNVYKWKDDFRGKWSD